VSVHGPRLRPAAYREIAALMYRWTGIRLYGKEHLVEGRLGPKLKQLESGYTQLIARIAHAGPESDEGRQFINSLTTNKTSFFREAHHFDFIRDVVIKAAIRAAATTGKRSLRLWSAACSSGEEPCLCGVPSCVLVLVLVLVGAG
jgi:chemotaxis protein methyltransferase CheR